MIKNLAELKRTLQIGVTLEMVYSLYPANKLLNIPRKIVTVQTNSIALEGREGGRSWLVFRRAEFYQYTEDGFKVLEDIRIGRKENGDAITERKVLLEYKFVI